ncbi:MAG: permease [Clostridia bacterium]|nr:permease [Clostridia bacterium]
MKTRVDMITGFLDSGKTTYINALLQDENLAEEKIVVLQYEEGEAGVTSALLKDNLIVINALEEQKALEEYLEYIVEKFAPDKIIIEYNGMLALEKAFAVFEKRPLRKKYYLGNIVCLVDTSTFEMYTNNFGDILKNQIAFADHIVLNKVADAQGKKLEKTEKSIKIFNKNAKVFMTPFYQRDDTEGLAIAFDGISIYEAPARAKLSSILLGIFLFLAVAYLGFSVTRSVQANAIQLDLSGFEGFFMIFISILMQTFPFMLVGMFVSSIIQVFLSNDAVVKLFPKKFGLGFITAMFGGLFLPVCECAIVPVMARLVKKGVALPIAVTFMLSAPIINPIVIVSTLYAFPGHPEITIFRIYFGLVIALAVGIVLMLFPETNTVLLEKADMFTCDCIYCSTQPNGRQGFREKLRLMFLHTGEEFFSAGKYLVLGAFLTGLIQVAVPKDIFLGLWGKDGLALAVMMATAFLFSVCSTSDAFIARSFWNSFSTSSIMGFLVFGPMMDIKNLFMLFASFRKTFVIKLVLIIIAVAFAMLYFLTFLLI